MKSADTIMQWISDRFWPIAGGLGLCCFVILVSTGTPPKPKPPMTAPQVQTAKTGTCNDVPSSYREACRNMTDQIAENAPCFEMLKRGWQEQADRCFKETREFERDSRDRIRFQEGR